MTSAVVLGGGFAGVLTAAVLARHAEVVTVVEAGWYPSGPDARPGVPQAHHNHVLVSGGAAALDTVLPGVVDDLVRHGAHCRALPADALIRTAGGWFPRHRTDAYLLSASRWLVDHVVRRHALVGVSVLTRTRCVGLVGDRSLVRGVLLRAGGTTRRLAADVVVDATGRGSPAPRWLADLGAGLVTEETVDPGLAYATRVFRAPADSAGTPAVMLHPDPATGRPGLGGTLFPIEGGRWIVTITSTGDEPPPTDGPGFAAAARVLASPLIAELTAAAEPLTGVRTFHGTVNRRRYFERTALPAGFLVIGDALSAVNPVYSHGMSVAALGALRLTGELDRHGCSPTAVTAQQRAMAVEAHPAWQLATAQDRRRAGGRVGLPAAVLNDPDLADQFFRAQTLMPARATVPA